MFRITKFKESSYDYTRRVGSGRPAKIFNESGIVELKRLTDHKDGIFQIGNNVWMF